MIEEVKLFKFKNISVSVHFTVFLLLLLSLIFGPQLFIMLILLFLSVFIHEFFHAAVARSYSLHIKKILLLPFGGITDIAEWKLPADKEIKVSLAGPLSNLFIAFVSAAFSVFFAPPLISWFQYFFWVNLILGLFNLIPAFPLDGGKIARAILSNKYGYTRATFVVKSIGNLTALLMVLASAATSYISGDISYILWSVIFVIILQDGNRVEVTYAVLSEALHGLKALDVMDRSFIVVNEKTPPYKILEAMKKHLYIVTEHKKEFYILDFSSLPNAKSGVFPNIFSMLLNSSRRISAVEANEDALQIFPEINEKGACVVIKNKKVIGVVTLYSIQVAKVFKILKDQIQKV